jgi:peptidoglycan/xylan/chitin deacetylase (PgdA/CDA1 family)
MVAGTWVLQDTPWLTFGGLVVHRLQTTDKVVALTFDDGPSDEHTIEVLDMLNRLDVKATFFLSGSSVAAHPQTSAQIAARGHDLGNHGYSHERMLFRSQAWIADEIDRTDDLLRATGYKGRIFFRPPYGKQFISLLWYLRSENRTLINWDINADRSPRSKDAESIAAYVIDAVQPGSIVLLHVMWHSRQASRDALPLIVQGLRERGYRFMRLSQMLSS